MANKLLHRRNFKKKLPIHECTKYLATDVENYLDKKKLIRDETLQLLIKSTAKPWKLDTMPSILVKQCQEVYGHPVHGQTQTSNSATN